ncbi:MAG TPA: hypothetical protein VLA21_08035 [Candidatus Limnocylindria bacterium]|nr:hypothetical protein [Candidatus Limnocylindria bacterium]
MDSFREEVVTRRNRTLESVVYMAANVVMVISGLYSLFMIQVVLSVVMSGGFTVGMLPEVIFLLMMAAAAVLLFLYRDRIRTEYEYTFTNGTLDFAHVYNNRKRRPLGTMNVRNVEAMGYVHSGSFRRYSEMPGVNQLRWFINRDAKLFYMYFTKDTKKTLLVMEPTEEMVELIRRFAGQGKFQTN